MRELAAYQTFEPFTNAPAEALAQRIAGIAPMDGAKVFFTPAAGPTPSTRSQAGPRLLARGGPGRQADHHLPGARLPRDERLRTTLARHPGHAALFGPLVAAVEHVAWDDPEALDKLISQLGADRVARSSASR